MTPETHFVSRAVLTAVAVSILSAGAYADGCFVWRRGADLNEPAQKAIIHEGYPLDSTYRNL